MLELGLYQLSAHSISSGVTEELVMYLLARAIEGDHMAFAELIREHNNMVRKMAFRITQSYDDTEDVVQESMMRAFRNLHTFKGEAKFSTWLSRITINTALMFLRRKKRLNETSIDATAPDDLVLSSLDGRISVPQEEVLQRTYCSELIRRAVKRLPVQLREVVELRIMHELSTHEVALRLGITAAAVKARLHRGKKHIRRYVVSLQVRTRPYAQVLEPVRY